MAEYNVKSPIKMDSLEATVQKSVVQIGNITAAFAGIETDMLSSYRIEFTSEAETSVAEAI